MKKINEKVQPFSNLSEFMNWNEKNCSRCSKYENKSTDIENAGCKLAFALDLGSVTDGLIDAKLLEIAGGKTKLPGKCLNRDYFKN